MENKPTNIEELFEKVKDYADTRIDLIKLKSINKASSIISSAITIVVVSLLFITVLVSITIGLALVLGELVGKTYYGFFIVAGIYLIIGLVLFSVREKLIKAPIANKLIKSFFN